MPLPKSVLSLAEQELLLKKARSELREEQMLQARPDVPAWRKNLAAQFEASLRAEVKLRKKELVFYRKLHRLQNVAGLISADKVVGEALSRSPWQ